MDCVAEVTRSHLANPARMEQYSGIKHADDKNDAFFLAELQRLNILPTGYIYDPTAATGARSTAAPAEFGASTHGADAEFQEPLCPDHRTSA